MTDLLAHIEQTIRRYALFAPGNRIVVGVSGGVDSLALLHLLTRLRQPWALDLRVATLDHGLRGAAGAADAAFVRQTALAWGLPVTVGRAEVRTVAQQARMGLEEAARQVRYAFLLRVARHVGADVIAVAHNRDDQAETVLMHLVRGSGLSGLRGMLPRTRLSDYHLLNEVPFVLDPPPPGDAVAPDSWPDLVRPLLETPRAALEAYVAAQGLEPRQDATNADLTFFRNRLRHEVIPLLETLNPNLRARLAHTADVLRADAEWLAAAGAVAWAQTVRDTRPGLVILDRTVWAGRLLAEKRHILRAAISRLRPALRDVAFRHIEDALRVADTGETGAEATLPGGLALRVAYDTLVVLSVGDVAAQDIVGASAPALPPGTSATPFVAGERARRVFGAWIFEAGPPEPGLDLAAMRGDALAVVLDVPPGSWLALRTRRRGDRFRPHGLGGHSQKLADTLTGLKVPAAWRDRVPLLTVDGEIAWLVVPVPGGVRGRVAQPFALRGADVPGAKVRVVARWRQVEIMLD